MFIEFTQDETMDMQFGGMVSTSNRPLKDESFITVHSDQPLLFTIESLLGNTSATQCLNLSL